MLSNKRIAIAILNYNGLNLLKKFLPSVVKHSDKKLSTIYIIDNGSDDESNIYVKNKFPEIKIIQNDKNYGYAGGYNKGLSKIDYDYYMIHMFLYILKNLHQKNKYQNLKIQKNI